MNSKIKNVLAAGVLAAASLPAFAGVPFTVDTSQGYTDAGTGTTFTSDSITGTYEQAVIVTSAGANPTYESTVLLSFTSFGVFPNVTGLTTDYGLYATINIKGTVTDASNFPTSISTGNWTGDYQMWLDVETDTNSFDSAKVAGYDDLDFTAAELDDDLLLMSGSIVNGGSTGSATNGGYDLKAEANLTTAGENFFIYPDPFYAFLMSTGDIEDFFSRVDLFGSIGQVQRFDGEASVEFAIPEPSTIALFGLTLVGLAFGVRRQS